MMNKIFKHKIFIPLVLIFSLLLITSCKKFIEIPPPSYQTGSEVVFTNDGTATAAILGIYSEMMQSSLPFAASSTTFDCGMYADELSYYAPIVKDEFLKCQLTEESHGQLATSYWTAAYRYIYTANLCLEKLEKASGLTEGVRRQLTGEAKFIRSFCFFYLINLFGDVPLTLSTDFSINAVLPRTANNIVYSQIVSDLIDAKEKLTANYAGGNEKIRPNKWTATALLARVYLYNEEWQKAEAESNVVINSGQYSLVTNLNNVYLKNSPEAIWQLQPVNVIWNTWEGRNILFATSSTPPTYYISNNLLYSFEPGDIRKTSWISSRNYLSQQFYYPYKYKVYGNNAPVTEYYMAFRLGEQFLIRAEAKAMQNNLMGAATDINAIRTRAGLSSITFANKVEATTAIENERRHELFAEWGHRWFDLKLTRRADAVIGVQKPLTWQSTDVLWPIPISQINANPYLIQNPGY